jgi:hypothetical protein
MNDDWASIAVGHADFEQRAISGWAYDHGEAVSEIGGADRIAQRMAHVVIGDAMLAGAGRDVWHTQPSYLAA